MTSLSEVFDQLGLITLARPAVSSTGAGEVLAHPVPYQQIID